MTQQGKVAQLDLVDMLGFGGLGEVWRARDAQGQEVVLRRVGRVDATTLREVRRLATVVRSLPTAHLVRLRRCLGDGDDRVLVVDGAASSLTALIAARGRLSPGEVVTVVAPLAEALGQAHGHGLAHGRVGLSSVLLTESGMPLLDGLGLEPLRPGVERLDVADPALAADDVRALGRLCVHLLTGEAGPQIPPGPLAEVVTAALGQDPPRAADLGPALLAACRAAPLLGLSCRPAPPAPRRRDLRPVGLAAAAVLALLGVVAVGWTWGARGPAAVQVATVRPDWRAVLVGLDAQRERAFATADPSVLRQVWATDAPANAQDGAAVTTLRASRRTARGVRHEVTSAAPLVVRPDRVELSVVQRLGALQVLEGGRVLERRPAGPEVRCTVVLARGRQGWRIAEVRPV